MVGSSCTLLSIGCLKNSFTQTLQLKKRKVVNFLKSNWFKLAAIALAFFASSTYDVSSDGLLAKSFIGGTNYTRHVEFPNRDCKLIRKL